MEYAYNITATSWEWWCRWSTEYNTCAERDVAIAAKDAANAIWWENLWTGVGIIAAFFLIVGYLYAGESHLGFDKYA